MERKVRKTFSKLRRLILNQPYNPKIKVAKGGGAESRAVRVNLPAELGGGFTMVVCQLEQQPTIRSFTSQIVGMCQATNTALLEAPDWGLSLPQDEDEDTAAPRVFLHPDTAISTVLAGIDDESEMDLLRLRAARVKQSPRERFKAQVQPDEDDDSSQENSALTHSGGSGKGSIRVVSASRPTSSGPAMQRVSSDDEHEADQWTRQFKVDCSGSSGKHDGTDVRWSRDPATVRSPFDPPPAALPTHKTQLRYSLLQQLKQLRPPQSPIPSPLMCLLAPPALAPPLLSPPSSSHLAVPGNQRDAASSGGGSSPRHKPSSKEERRREDERRKEREREVAAIDAVLAGLAAKDIGQLRPPARSVAKRKAGEEEEDDESKELEDDGLRRKRFEWCGGEKEVPLFFCALPPPPPAAGAKSRKTRPDPTDNCFVLTSLRALQVEEGRVTLEARIGPGSGGVISVPKRQPVAGGQDGGSVRMRLRVRELENGESNVREDRDSDSDKDGRDEDAKADAEANGSDEDEDEQQRRGKKQAAAKHSVSVTVSFVVPSTAVAAYVQQYVLYMQSTVTLSQTLSLLSSPTSSSHTATPYRHALLGWTMLLKSFIGPLVFGPLRLPLYTHQIKQLLARVQQLQLKNVQVTSLKLLQFHLPRPELDENGDELDEDFIPSLSLRSFRGHPHHEYTFDVSWSCPSFLVRVEIQGKRVVSFKLELEMRGIEVAGCVLLRSTPYAPEQLAVSFMELPSLSFGVASKVIVGSVQLPFQHSIERLITQQIQRVLQTQLQERALYPKLISVYFAKSSVSLLLDRWWSVAKFPFKFDGKDDEEMMGLALVVTTQAEHVVGETLRQMRAQREKMADHLTRPLYGEDAADDWQVKEKQRLAERERERLEQEQGSAKRPGKKIGKESKEQPDRDGLLVERDHGKRKQQKPDDEDENAVPAPSSKVKSKKRNSTAKT